MPTVELLATKYGLSAQQAQDAQRQMEQRAAAVDADADTARSIAECVTMDGHLGAVGWPGSNAVLDVRSSRRGNGTRFPAGSCHRASGCRQRRG